MCACAYKRKAMVERTLCGVVELEHRYSNSQYTCIVPVP